MDFVKVFVLGAAVVSTAATTQGRFYSQPTSAAPKQCKGKTAGDNLPDSCCDQSIESDPVNHFSHAGGLCTLDDTIEDYYYGIECLNAKHATFKDDCNPTCSDCFTTDSVAIGKCVYTTPVDGSEWYIKVAKGACAKPAKPPKVAKAPKAAKGKAAKEKQGKQAKDKKAGKEVKNKKP